MPSKISEFEDLIDNLQVGFFRSTMGKSPQFVYVNDELCKVLGQTEKQIMKLSPKEIFFDQRRFTTFTKTVKQDESVKDFEARMKYKMKTPLWCSLSARLIQEGKAQFVDVVVLDRSRQKKNEKDLIESKELFQTVFKKTAAAITVTDKDEMIVAWNPFAEKMLGMDKKSLFNLPVKDLYPPKEWKRMRSFRIRQKGMLSDIETQVYKKDGSILDVNVSISVLKDLDGNITGSIGIIRDITAQKTAERQIKESENKIRVILDNSAAGITMIDSQERIISWNKFAEHLLGMKRKDLYLKPVSSLYPKEEWRKIREAKIRKVGSKHHMETKVIHKKGHVIDIDLSINVLNDANNNVIGAVGIMQDITEQKRFQEMLVQAKLSAEEANSTKSLFLANMSHEVRTPMNAILGMIDLTLDTKLSDDQKENLIVAKDAADNLLGLLNDILDLSRVEAGKITLESIEFHLPNVAQSVCKGLSVMAGNKGLKIEVEIDEKVPDLVEGDPVRLRQVLINLINNAIKFTHKGKIVVGIGVSSSKSQKRYLLHFYVKDEGIGIPKDRHEKVFDVFTQADDTTTRKFGGTGLGLAICKRLVEMMGGRIWVESEEGQGSTFQFTANFKVIQHKKSASLLEQADGVTGDDGLAEDIKDLKVLLAEDNLVNQKISSRMLEKAGANVTAVENGQQVIDKIDAESFDVVLMDAQMPVLDGLEATKIIRANEKSTGKHIPIIALTARAMEEDRKKCLEVGMDGYVAKPIDRKKLFQEIANTLKKGKVT